MAAAIKENSARNRDLIRSRVDRADRDPLAVVAVDDLVLKTGNEPRRLVRSE